MRKGGEKKKCKGELFMREIEERNIRCESKKKGDGRAMNEK